ncbi:hypothetical protein Tco_1369110 [Tanacetum coccineum]
MSKLLRTFCSVSNQSILQEQVIHGGRKSVNLVATKDNPSFYVNAQHVQVSSTGMFGPIPSKSIGRFGNTSSITTEVTSDSLFTSSLNEVGLPQSPLVSHTAHLPLHQSNVDVAATFGVLLSTVGDLEVLITDIDAGKCQPPIQAPPVLFNLHNKHNYKKTLNTKACFCRHHGCI